MKSIESDLFGHPRGIFTLFLVEMWERFSYYGMRAFLILYMTAPVASGGLGFEVDQAGRAYGFYTGGVWLATIGGGLLADWFLGRYLSVTVGAILIILGHITLAFPAVPVFFGGLFLIVVGTGFLKPNISAMAGSLYHANDPRRDAGFSIFYMGINLGAAIGPIVAGFLAQRVGWHLGFACAALGMVFGLFQLYRGRNYLLPALKHTEQEREALWRGPALSWQSFSPAEWKRLAAILIFFLFASIFWAAYEQAGTTLNLFADRYTRLDVWGFDVPSSWFQSVPAVFVIVLAPLFAALWMR
ncbi:MAG TPA: peptide MFS transporter, partial [Terrimicrobiaceae bacterium]